VHISPDSIVLWRVGPVALNATIFCTWLVMGLLLLMSWLVTRRLKVEPPLSRWQNFLEALVSYMRDQIAQITQQEPTRYLPFLGTLFLFISLSNLLAPVPLYEPPTASLSTAAALAVCVFFAVPIYGVARCGVFGYLKHYVQPTPLMLPFTVVGELSRTLALAVRLFGNMMSGTMIAGIMLVVAPLLVPVLMEALGLLIGQIQAYIFAVLAAVYIASGTRADRQAPAPEEQPEGGS